MTVEEICAAISACTGAPTDTDFKKYSLQLLCAIEANGGGSVQDIQILCDDLGSENIVPFYRILTRDSEGVITVENYELDATTPYTPSGTLGVCDAPVTFPDFPEYPVPEELPDIWDAEVLKLCDNQGGGTIVEFFRIVYLSKAGVISYEDRALLDLSEYTVIGTVESCDLSVSTGEQFAGEICYDDSGTIKSAIRVGVVTDGLFTGVFRFFDAITGDSVAELDVVDCPIPGGSYDVFPDIDEWASDSCFAGTAFFDVDSMDDKSSEPCLPVSWRLNLVVDGLDLHTGRLISFSYADSQSVDNSASGTPEPLDGAPQFFIDRLNELTSPYLTWEVVDNGVGGYQIQMYWNSAQSIQFSITRLHDCGNDPAGETYSFDSTANSNAGEWSDTDDDRDFQAAVWDGNTCV